MSNICVAHLVRKKNGIAPFRCFLESYLRHSAGIGHELLILYKGFAHQGDITPYEELLRDLPHSFLSVSNFGFDLRPYFIAAEKSDSEYLCFLNSFSIIQDNDWLLKLYRRIGEPGVGLVGATGSWGSICTGRRIARKELPLWKKLLSPLALIITKPYRCQCFDCFPNPHIRTNGFMISRDTMLEIHRDLLLTKIHAHRLESGKNGITKQVERMGLKPVVVGKDGRGYDKQEWHISGTFFRGRQRNLLISDNQTRRYDAEDESGRQNLEYFAWGEIENLQAEKFGEV